MKNKILKTALAISLGMMIFSSSLSWARGNTDLPADVVAEHNQTIYFAPEHIRGTYRFQIKTDGTVQEVDNKGKITLLGTLAPKLISNIVAKADLIESDELTQPEGPRCADAPFSSIQVRQSNGSTHTVWIFASCREHESIDQNGHFIQTFVTDLMNLLKSVKFHF